MAPTVERTVPSAVIQERDAESVSSLLRYRPHASSKEDQRSTPICRCQLCCLFYCVDVQVSAGVIDPAEVLRAIEIARFARRPH